jgi:hypothetical protein
MHGPQNVNARCGLQVPPEVREREGRNTVLYHRRSTFVFYSSTYSSVVFCAQILHFDLIVEHIHLPVFRKGKAARLTSLQGNITTYILLGYAHNLSYERRVILLFIPLLQLRSPSLTPPESRHLPRR